LNAAIIPCIQKYTEIFNQYQCPFKAVIKYIAIFRNIRTGETKIFRDIHSFVKAIRFQDEIQEVVNEQIDNILNGFLRNSEMKETAWKWFKSIAIRINIYRYESRLTAATGSDVKLQE
jgi:hypothetical protein